MDGQDPWCSLSETGDKIVKLRVTVHVQFHIHVKVKAHCNFNDQTHDAQMRLLSSSGSGSALLQVRWVRQGPWDQGAHPDRGWPLLLRRRRPQRLHSAHAPKVSNQSEARLQVGVITWTSYLHLIGPYLSCNLATGLWLVQTYNLFDQEAAQPDPDQQPGCVWRLPGLPQAHPHRS